MIVYRTLTEADLVSDVLGSRWSQLSYGFENLLWRLLSRLESYHLPAGMTYNELHDGLKQHGFIIYAGQGELAAKLFRISTMGEISDYDMGRLEQALQKVIGG